MAAVDDAVAAVEALAADATVSHRPFPGMDEAWTRDLGREEAASCLRGAFAEGTWEIGGARYAVPGHTFCKTCYLPGGMDGNRIDFGAAPLEARRDIVAAAVAQFGFLTAYPELG